MGKPLTPAANPTVGTPPVGDQATTVVAGSFTAAGQVSQPIVIYGSFNVAIWLSLVDELTTAAASATATVNSGTGVTAGQSINSTLVPPGTVVAAVSTTTITLGGLTNAQIAAIAAGTDANATFTGAGVSGDVTVQLEKSFDGGATWLVVNQDKNGTACRWELASAHINNAVDFTQSETAERGVAYRLTCPAYASGTANYRISNTSWGASTGTPPV